MPDSIDTTTPAAIAESRAADAIVQDGMICATCRRPVWRCTQPIGYEPHYHHTDDADAHLPILATVAAATTWHEDLDR